MAVIALANSRSYVYTKCRYNQFAALFPLTPTATILVPRPFQSGNEPIQRIVGARALAERAAGTASSPDIESWSSPRIRFM